MVDCYQPLTDLQWQVMESLLPTQRKRRHSLPHMLDAMLYICRTGCQWRDLPACFPPWPAVYYYFARWRADGTFERLSQASNRAARLAQGAKRWVVERTFAWLNCLRRVVIDYERQPAG